MKKMIISALIAIGISAPVYAEFKESQMEADIIVDELANPLIASVFSSWQMVPIHFRTSGPATLIPYPDFDMCRDNAIATSATYKDDYNGGYFGVVVVPTSEGDSVFISLNTFNDSSTPLDKDQALLLTCQGANSNAELAIQIVNIIKEEKIPSFGKY